MFSLSLAVLIIASNPSLLTIVSSPSIASLRDLIALATSSVVASVLSIIALALFKASVNIAKLASV